jgi:hypothetical protein
MSAVFDQFKRPLGSLRISVTDRWQPIELIQKVELEIGFIIFEDKTDWTAGSFLRQDPNNPDRYNPIGSEPPR